MSSQQPSAVSVEVNAENPQQQKSGQPLKKVPAPGTPAAAAAVVAGATSGGKAPPTAQADQEGSANNEAAPQA